MMLRGDSYSVIKLVNVSLARRIYSISCTFQLPVSLKLLGKSFL